MLDIIALIFLCISNGKLAAKKGLKTLPWKIYTAIAWVVAEVVGLMIGFSMFGKTNLLGVMVIGVFCAFGGYLFVRKTLENKPDALDDDDVKQIGIDDVCPPKR